MSQPQAVLDEIIALAVRGVSRSVIANRVGLTRSAVIGILWRRKVRPVALVERVERKPRQLRPRAPEPPIEPVLNPPDSSLFVAWADLDPRHQCWWPVEGRLW